MLDPFQPRKVARARQKADARRHLLVPAEREAAAAHQRQVEAHGQVEDDREPRGEGGVMDHRAVWRGDVGDGARAAGPVHHQIADRLEPGP